MTHRKRVTLKIKRSPEELAKLEAERERFSREHPDAADLLTAGDHEGPYRQGNIMALLSAIAEL